MSNMERNRRRNQIIAERSADKAALLYNGSSYTEKELWAHVEAALGSALHTQRWMGHVDKAVEAARGREAARQLRLRGVQQQLF